MYLICYLAIGFVTAVLLICLAVKENEELTLDILVSCMAVGLTWPVLLGFVCVSKVSDYISKIVIWRRKK